MAVTRLGNLGPQSRSRRAGLLAAVLALLALAGCTARKPSAGPTTTPATKTSASPSPSVSRTDAAGTVWLCRPGLADNPCAQDLAATVLDGTSTHRVVAAPPATDSPYDCFYAYPTVSQEAGPNADLTVGTAERLAAAEQASRFSQVCQVWAPVYRQRTSADLDKGIDADPAADLVAYNSLLAAWQDYLATFNHGRPVIFLGHSQGAIALNHLLATQVDPDPALRGRLVSAILVGANVQVPTGRAVGGSFQHIPTCAADAQTGCVIAYSSFSSQPPADSLFGIPGQGVSVPQGLPAAGQQVVCTNPAALSGGTGALDAFGPAILFLGSLAAITTPWVEDTHHYVATCSHAGNATWLQVSDIAPAGDPRPRLPQSLGPTWGLHLYDVNVALGNLVSDVAHQEAAYHSPSG